MPQYLLRFLMIFSFTALPLVGRAADDPSLRDIYEAANNGHLLQAQQMIGRVLADHPGSAKAHYVAAELDARQGQVAGAREQLATAERLAPGLPFAKPDATAALRAQLGQVAVPSVREVQTAGPARPGMPFGLMFGLLIGVVILLVMLARNRQSATTTYAPAYSGGGYGPAGGVAQNGGVMPGGGGVGSGIGGGLASGLAVGAGVVAGEALAHHFLDGGLRERAIDPSPNAGLVDRDDLRGNANMGGNDFGITDSSWDDNSSGTGSSDSGSDDWD